MRICPNNPFDADHRYRATGGTVSSVNEYGQREVTVLHQCKWCGKRITTTTTKFGASK